MAFLKRFVTRSRVSSTGVQESKKNRPTVPEAQYGNFEEIWRPALPRPPPPPPMLALSLSDSLFLFLSLYMYIYIYIGAPEATTAKHSAPQQHLLESMSLWRAVFFNDFHYVFLLLY